MGLREAVKINIEPGLFEWLFWHRDSIPDCFTNEEALKLGYNVNPDYKPIVTAKELTDNQETCGQFYNRNYVVSRKVAKETAARGGNILLVAHAASLDTCLRQLTGHQPRTPQDLTRVIHKVPYCSMSVAREDDSVKEEEDVNNKSSHDDDVANPADTRMDVEESHGANATKTRWQMIEPFCPPFTNSSNMRFDWKVLLS
jgi:ubiquitin-associated SH3 domain-containing protein